MRMLNLKNISNLIRSGSKQSPKVAEAAPRTLEELNSLYRVVNVPFGSNIDEINKAAEFGTTIPSMPTIGRRTGYSDIQRNTPFDVLNTSNNQNWIAGQGLEDQNSLINLYGGNNPYIVKMSRENPFAGPETLNTLNNRTDILKNFRWPYEGNVGVWDPTKGQFNMPLELGEGVFTTFGKDADELAKIRPGSIVNPNYLSRDGNDITTIFGPKGMQVRQPQEVMSAEEYFKRMTNDPNFKYRYGGSLPKYQPGGGHVAKQAIKQFIKSPSRFFKSQSIGKGLTDAPLTFPLNYNTPLAPNIINHTDPLPANGFGNINQEALVNWDAAVLNNNFSKQADNFKLDIPLTRVLDSKGISIRDGKLFSKTGDHYYAPDFTSSRNTTHWSYGHIGDPGHGGGLWSKKSTAIISDFKTLKGSGHAMDLNPTDTYFYSKDDFKIPDNSLILTRDKSLYDKIRLQTDLVNVKWVDPTQVNDEQFKALVDSYSTNGPKKYNYQDDLFNDYLNTNWEQGMDVAQYKPASYLDKNRRDHFGGGQSKMHSNDPLSYIESIQSKDYRKNHGLYGEIETWKDGKDFGKGIGTLDAMLEWPKPMQVLEMEKLLRLYKHKPEALKVQTELANLNGFETYKEFKASVSKAEMDNFKKDGGEQLPKAQFGKGLVRALNSKNLVQGFNKVNKSSIDNFPLNWGNFNESILDNKILRQEYKMIEETTKANATWMKNADGSVFVGTPEQFVQQQSGNFQKAFPQVIREDGVIVPLVHHSNHKFNFFDKTKQVRGKYGDGVYTRPVKFYDKRIAEDAREMFKPNSEKTLMQFYGDIRYDLYSNDIPELKKLEYRNEWGVFDPKSNNIKYDDTSIVLSPYNNPLKSTVNNNGLFDMTKANIYEKEGGENLPKAQFGLGRLVKPVLSPLKKMLENNALYRTGRSGSSYLYDNLLNKGLEKSALPHLLRGEQFVDNWYADPEVALDTESLYRNMYTDPSPFTQFNNWGEYSNFVRSNEGRISQDLLRPFLETQPGYFSSTKGLIKENEGLFSLMSRMGEQANNPGKSYMNPRIANSELWLNSSLNPDKIGGVRMNDGWEGDYPINITRKGFQTDPQGLFDIAAHEKSHWYVRGSALVPKVTNRWEKFVSDDAFKIIKESSKTGRHPKGYDDMGDIYYQTPVEVQARVTETRGLLSDMGFNNAQILSLQTFGLGSIDDEVAEKVMNEITASRAGQALFDSVVKDGKSYVKEGEGYQKKAFDNLFNLMRYTPVVAAPIVGAEMLQEEEGLSEQKIGGEIKKHTIVRGDTGKTLFEKYGVNSSDIKEHNDIKFFKEGQEIEIPSKELSKAQDGRETPSFRNLHDESGNLKLSGEELEAWRSPRGYTYKQLADYNNNIAKYTPQDGIDLQDKTTWEGKHYGSPFNSSNYDLFSNNDWNPQSYDDAYGMNRDIENASFFYQGQPYSTESKEELENSTPSQKLIDFNNNIAQITQDNGLYGESLQKYIDEMFPEGSRERNFLNTYEANNGKGLYTSFIKDNEENMHMQSLYRDLDNAQNVEGTEAVNTSIEQEAIMDFQEAIKARMSKEAQDAYSGPPITEQMKERMHDEGEIRQDYAGIPYNAQFLYDAAPGLAGNPAAQRKFATENPASPTNALAMGAMAAPLLAGAGMLSSIPLGAGFVTGDLMNAGFAYNALSNTLPQAATDLYDGNYLDALGNATIGGLELMGSPTTFMKGYRGLQNNVNLFPKLNTQRAVNSLVPNARSLNDYGLRTTENLSLTARDLPAWSLSGKPNQIQARNYFRNNFNPTNNTLLNSIP